MAGNLVLWLECCLVAGNLVSWQGMLSRGRECCLVAGSDSLLLMFSALTATFGDVNAAIDRLLQQQMR